MHFTGWPDTHSWYNTTKADPRWHCGAHALDVRFREYSSLSTESQSKTLHRRLNLCLPSTGCIRTYCRYPTSSWSWCPNECNDYSSNLIRCFHWLSKYRKFRSNYFSNLIGCFIWLSEYSNECFSNLIVSYDHSHYRQLDYDFATVFFAYRNFDIIKQPSANDDK
jgi:hypothetical protein